MGHFNRVYNYDPYNFVIGASTYGGVSLLPGQMNFVLKTSATCSIAGITTFAAYQGANTYLLASGEILNTDGAANLWIATSGVTCTVWVLPSRSQGFENTSG